MVGEEDAKEKDLLVARTGSGTKGYLDTLSDASWKMSTWEVYKGQVENAKEVQLDEIDCKLCSLRATIVALLFQQFCSWLTLTSSPCPISFYKTQT